MSTYMFHVHPETLFISVTRKAARAIDRSIMASLFRRDNALATVPVWCEGKAHAEHLDVLKGMRAMITHNAWLEKGALQWRLRHRGGCGSSGTRCQVAESAGCGAAHDDCA